MLSDCGFMSFALIIFEFIYLGKFLNSLNYKGRIQKFCKRAPERLRPAQTMYVIPDEFASIPLKPYFRSTEYL